MKKGCDIVVFRKYSGNWVIPLTCGFCTLIVSFILRHHLYFLYIYLFLVSALIFISSFQKFSILTDDRLLIYFGKPYNKKSIEVHLDDIEDLKVVTEANRDGFYSGGFPIVSYKNIDHLSIALKNPLKTTLIESIPENRIFFPCEVTICDSGDEILIKSKPVAGYSIFIQNVAERIPLPLESLSDGHNKLKAC